MIYKITNKIKWLIFLLFGLSITLLFLIYFIEGFTYLGFLAKHFYINSNVVLNIAVSTTVGVFVILFKFDSNIIDIKIIVKKYAKLFLMISGIIIASIVFLNLVEILNYSNFVYSRVHIQPKLIQKSLYPLVTLVAIVAWISLKEFNINKIIFFKKTILFMNIILKKLFNKKIPKLSTTLLKKILVKLYTVLILLFVIQNMFVFVPSFYKVDRTWKQENELKYFLGDMDIYDWVSESLPRTKDIISWCETQNTPVDIVSFDPQIIWLSYDALSRVFLTNCQYVNINPVSKSFQYLDDDELLLVSVSRCDRSLVDTKPDPDVQQFEYFKIINNRYICDSEEILPNLYHFKK